MSLLKVVGAFPTELQGTLTQTLAPSTDYPVGSWVYVGTWGSQTFKAKVVKFAAGGTSIRVKRISGSIASGASLKCRAADGLSDVSGATGTLDTISTATIGKDVNNVGGLDINYGGWNIRETNQGITRSKVVDLSPLRIQAEVLVAQQSLYDIRNDFVTIPTFTLSGGVWSTADTYDISNGDKITFTIIASEPVRLPVGTTYPFTLTDATTSAKNGTLTASSTDGLTHTFSYLVGTNDGDTNATAVAITNGSSFNLNSGTAYEVAVDGSMKSFTPGTITGVLTGKSVTVQA